MSIFRFKSERKEEKEALAVQTGSSYSSFRQYNSFIPMSENMRLYAQLKNDIPIINAAIMKIIRLTTGFHLEVGSDRENKKINEFFSSINVGGNMKGLSSFVDCYFDSLLTFGSAIGEMVITNDGLIALYNGEMDCIEVKRASDNLNIEFYNNHEKIAHPERLLFSVLNARSGQLLGTSLLSGLPFMCDILLKIYNTIGENWEHAGNIRYAVTYKPTSDMNERAYAHDRAEKIADAWKDAMSSKSVKDFVAVGDVDVKVIGADNKTLDSEIPVKQLLEQIVAKTGVPPYMLGLSWSTTEKMSQEQSDILTSELENYRRILTPVIKKIANTYMILSGKPKEVTVVWDDITLQDETQLARAELYYAQAEKIKKEEQL